MKLHIAGLLLAAAYAASGVLIFFGMQTLAMIVEFHPGTSWHPLPLLTKGALLLPPTAWLVFFVGVAVAIVVKDGLRPITKAWPYIAGLACACAILVSAILLPVMVIVDPVAGK